MAARTPTSTPAFTTASEKQVHDRLVRQLPETCWVIPNLRVSDQTKDHEADLLVLMPDSGIVVVEVKGSHCWTEDGRWMIMRDGQPTVIHPQEQARDAVLRAAPLRRVRPTLGLPDACPLAPPRRLGPHGVGR